jgi:hypothetical protein
VKKKGKKRRKRVSYFRLPTMYATLKSKAIIIEKATTIIMVLVLLAPSVNASSPDIEML